MSVNAPFTKENLDISLKELAKEYRKRSGKSMPAEIILVGGVAVLANYGFREVTYDVDAIISASSVMKEAINHVGDKLGLPNHWLNADFRKTASFSKRLLEISVYYKTFSNIVEVRYVAAQYLIAMKLISARQYKHDLSDIVGILWEHQKSGHPVTRASVDDAIIYLYGDDARLSPIAENIINDAYKYGDLEQAYIEIREAEKQARETLLDVESTNPIEHKGESIDAIVKKAMEKSGKK
jgi:hypothetical protein